MNEETILRWHTGFRLLEIYDEFLVYWPSSLSRPEDPQKRGEKRQAAEKVIYQTLGRDMVKLQQQPGRPRVMTDVCGVNVYWIKPKSEPEEILV